MDILRGATRVLTETANATTSAAGAVGGAAINGIVGGVQGTAKGIREGVSNGSHSTPAAILGLGAIGAAGLVEWPVVLTVGGTALLVRQFTHREGPAATATEPASSSTRRSPRPRPAKKAAKSAPHKTTRSRSPKR